MNPNSKNQKTQNQGLNIKEVICQLILNGIDNTSIMKTVKTLFPEGKTTIKSVHYYRCQLKGHPDNKGTKTNQPTVTDLSKLVPGLKIYDIK